MPAPLLTVLLDSPAQVASQRTHVEQGGLFVSLPEPPPEPFAEIPVLVVAPDGSYAQVAARVVHLAPGSGAALAFTDPKAARAEIERLLARFSTEPATGEAAPPRVRWGRPVDVAAEEEAPAEPEELDLPANEEGSTLYDRIRAMSTSERMRLAQNGDRAARLLLMKDPNKAIHPFLLQNPRITVDEVRYFAANRQASPEALRLIGENREWTQNPRVVGALVANPKTPSILAVRLLEKLPLSDLRRIAKSDGYPKAVTAAARKKVIGG